ncbi:MAG: FAD-dependent oxidoreductase [Rhodospirillaceae bacterium]|jgi:2-polyprenyl-6-methoxyphenol hydroxylase-like FAD-dependent oxidoreductase|nr:FAD-dependent oxidoreductase [Rhodospirillaceae bacterium]MBT5195340.1 FAD-dependent oxidoreductase [Rhodospirillaceae bacterium]MBT5894367.1 FAD-dependent oxidoreductase [Rhodospirillaceae bacterium]MBT6426726.1 FAD-dependent oxidoreductase [Rhodospirillaceae bacterium]MBT7757414.1 FAD-dependent oxidoreductase [Rhodospirillaceae bacterium]
MTTNPTFTSVLIVGAGPVGLTLAMDLAWRGIDVVVAETRARGEPPPPKCNHVAARSMEIFRRLGVAGKLRNAGLPPDYPNDISYRTSYTGRELTRIPIPCRRDRYDSREGPDTGWPTPEPAHRINQIFLEPILFDHAAQMGRITILTRTAVTAMAQDDDQVTATMENLDNGAITHIDCQYLIGCDGGSSIIRKSIGAKLEGDAVISRNQSSYIRAPGLAKLQTETPAWATFSLNPRRSGNVYAIDGVERFIIHNYLRPGETDFDAIDRDWGIRTILGVDDSFEYEILAKEDWIGRRLVADKFRDRRAFICGDAAHIWVPYGGYGMNAGIADAMNLSWVMAAHLNGWAPAAILDAYEAERLPITEQVSHFVMNHAHAMASQRGGVPDNIEDDGPDGDAARAQLGQQAYDLNVQQYCAAGLNFGYYYDQSPIIDHAAARGDTAPGYTMAEYSPSTVPGCRLPHLWLGDRKWGRSLYDALGPEYTLLRSDPNMDAAPLLNAAAAQGLPLALLDLPTGTYDHALVIARPDQHVAWRGGGVPDDPDGLINILNGAFNTAN